MSKMPQRTFLDEVHPDGRMNLAELFASYSPLFDSEHWEGDVAFEQRVLDEGGQVMGHLPVFSLRTKTRGSALYLIAGIHGEEPAGPNALARNVDFVDELRREGLPVVLLPMCNPAGYFRDWRYQDTRRGSGSSVGDSDHLVLQKKGRAPKYAAPISKEAEALTSHVLGLQHEWPADLVIDLHEDEDDGLNPRCVHPYIYSQGRRKTKDPVAKRVVEILKESGMSIQMSGRTRFKEKIKGGIVVGDGDGSIDQLLSAGRFHKDGKIHKKRAARSVVVVETPTLQVNGEGTRPLPLELRVRAHERAIRAIPEFLEML
ncbi:hypothetical protein HY605_03025 [Candidatus Peregrinibacteria bacterium]|nr:hypothetical protein [Candidatus Peregrinibacteria bacterium]